MNKNEIEINGDLYVKKSSVKNNVKDKNGKKLCIIRTYSAGVFMAWVDYEKMDFYNCVLIDSVRLWKWAGAFTLSALAVEGTSDPSECKFSISTPEQKVNRVIEMIPISENALKSLNSVKRG